VLGREPLLGDGRERELRRRDRGLAARSLAAKLGLLRDRLVLAALDRPVAARVVDGVGLAAIRLDAGRDAAVAVGRRFVGSWVAFDFDMELNLRVRGQGVQAPLAHFSGRSELCSIRRQVKFQDVVDHRPRSA